MRRDWTGGMERREGCRGSVTWREARIGELAGPGLKFRPQRRGRAGLTFGVVVSCVGLNFVPSPLLENGSAIWDLAPLLRCKMRTHSHKYNISKTNLLNLQIIPVTFSRTYNNRLTLFQKKSNVIFQLYRNCTLLLPFVKETDVRNNYLFQLVGTSIYPSNFCSLGKLVIEILYTKLSRTQMHIANRDQ